MKEKEYDIYLKSLVTDIEAVLSFEIFRRVKYFFKSSSEYIDCKKKFLDKDRSDNNKSLRRLERLFYVDRTFYEGILGQDYVIVDGKRKKIIREIVSAIANSSNHISLIQKCSKRYKKSNKTFTHLSFWLVKPPFDELIFNDKSILNAKSEHYTKTQCKIIYEHILVKGRKMLVRTYMTKKEKEQYEKEHAEEEHAEEEHIKDQQKKKRPLGKRRMTIAKKAAKQTLTEYAALQTKANTLEAMNAEKDEQIKEQQQQIDELRRMLQSNAESAKQINTTADVENEIPAAWTSWEGHYDYEGPNVEQFRSDGTQLEPKCMPSKWMDSSDLFDFREGKMDEDEFERLWQIYAMTDKEQDACKMTDESRAIAPSTSQWSQDKLDDQMKKCNALVDDGDLDGADKVFVIPRRLQEFIDKHYISLNEANWIAKLYREDFKLKEAKSGFSLEDRKTHLSARKTIVNQIIKEINHILGDEDLKRLRIMVV